MRNFVKNAILVPDKAYQSAWPFPHAVFDNFLPKEVLRALIEEVPEVGNCHKQLLNGTCFFEKNVQYNKYGVSDVSQFGPNTQAVFNTLKSRQWMEVLTRLTGIDSLVADKYNQGSGIHISGDEGHLQVHADFNVKKGLHRRVNTFLYLNPRWEDNYGGHLELWPRNLSRCGQRFAPTANRFVVFTSNDFSFHGHPKPMKLPKGRARRSLALYYYTENGRPASDCMKHKCSETESHCRVCERHDTMWKETHGGC